MRSDIDFIFRVSESERKMITALAEKLQRKEEDAVRYVVNQVAREIVAKGENYSPAPTVEVRNEG